MLFSFVMDGLLTIGLETIKLWSSGSLKRRMQNGGYQLTGLIWCRVSGGLAPLGDI